MKKEVKFKTQFNPSYKGTPHKNKSGKSMTQPSMSLTVKELMERHTRGLETGVEAKEELYLEDEVPRITDLTDLVYQREALEEQQAEIEQQIQNEIDARKREKLKEERNANTLQEPQSHEDDISKKSKETKE